MSKSRKSDSRSNMSESYIRDQGPSYNYEVPNKANQRESKLVTPIELPLEHRHKKGTVTCRHWRRGRCDLNELCNFAHHEDPNKLNHSDSRGNQSNQQTRQTPPTEAPPSDNGFNLSAQQSVRPSTINSQPTVGGTFTQSVPNMSSPPQGNSYPRYIHQRVRANPRGGHFTQNIPHHSSARGGNHPNNPHKHEATPTFPVCLSPINVYDATYANYDKKSQASPTARSIPDTTAMSPMRSPSDWLLDPHSSMMPNIHHSPTIQHSPPHFGSHNMDFDNYANERFANYFPTGSPPALPISPSDWQARYTGMPRYDEGPQDPMTWLDGPNSARGKRSDLIMLSPTMLAPSRALSDPELLDQQSSP